MERSVFLIGLVVGLLACGDGGSEEVGIAMPGDDPFYEVLYDELPFDMPWVSAPLFRDFAVSIRDFGAVADGRTLCTEAFRGAIAAVQEHGGGTVRVPRGVWLTGPIELRANVRLHAEEGALVLFSKNMEDYPLVEATFEGLETWRCQSPISAVGQENIAITGKGIFDGGGDAWRPVKRGKMAPGQWDRLLRSGGVLSDDGRVWYPSEQAKRGDAPGNFNVPELSRREQFERIKDYLRPVMVSLVKCKNVLLDGPTFQNSPAWNIHPLMCKNVIVRNLTVRNPWYSQNGDGLDLESCTNALVYRNTFDVGDDAICFKSGKNAAGRERGMPTQNVLVSHNTVYHGHGGFVIGSEMSGGVRNIKVTKCTFIGTDVGLRFKSTRGRGGVVENIFISDIDMTGIPTEAIRFNMFYGGNAPILEEGQLAETEVPDQEVVPVTEETPAFRNIFMRNINVTRSHTAAKFTGLPELKLEHVRLENARFETVRGISAVDCRGLELKGVELVHEEGAALTLYNSSEVRLSGCELEERDGERVRVLGPDSGKVWVE